MLALQKRIDALCRELEAERAENAKFRRMMEDVLYNLEDENMPSVAARLVKGERSIGLLVEDGQVRGGVLVEAINGASAVAINADKINMNGSVLVSRINNSSSVTIDADKVDLDGRVLVEKINGASAVTIDADKINLNGAVTANGNFEIHEDGSASCAALTVTGGSISLPDPADGSAVLSVHTTDATGGVTVYADRVAFAGQFVPGWEQEGALSLSQLEFRNEMDLGTGTVQTNKGFYRPGEVLLQCQDVEGETVGNLDRLRLTPRSVVMPYIATHPKEKTSKMRPVYIDEDGSLYAVAE